MRVPSSIVLVCSLSLALSACGGGKKEPEKAAVPPAKSTTPEAQVVVIHPVGEEMKYETTEFTVKAGTPVRVVMENTAMQPAMHHNVVITKPGTSTDEIGLAAVQAGEAKGYIPDHAAILFHTEMAAPGETKQVEFIAPAPGDYPYLCTFPGHYVFMKGVMHSTP
jgi:azurin